MNPSLAEALAAAKDVKITPKNLARLSSDLGNERARWALEQWDLRKRARSKFERAESMLFVREALEQATHERIAAYHASKFPSSEVVIDMTAGIGADTFALGCRGPVIAYELDPVRAEYCAFNVRDLPDVLIKYEDSLASEWDAGHAFADPARRVEGKRTTDPDQFQPNPNRLSERFQSLRLGLIKLSPMISDEHLESLGAGLEFISFEGECREALVLCGTDAVPGRFAVHLDSGSRIEAGVPPTGTSEIGPFVYDADPACIRAHAVGRLAAEESLAVLGDSMGYLTGTETQSPWLRAFRVAASGRFDREDIRSLLRREQCATPILKQRGAGQDLDKLGKEFRASGTRPCSMLFYRIDKSIRFVLGYPVKNT